MFTVALLARDIEVASSREVFIGTAKLLKGALKFFMLKPFYWMCDIA
jgi:hypothetical protein